MYTQIDQETTMTLSIDGKEIPVTWEDNASVNELKEICPLKINMSMYGGFEQVGSLGQSISRDDEQITTESGDIVLYSGNQIVVFYGSNSCCSALVSRSLGYILGCGKWSYSIQTI